MKGLNRFFYLVYIVIVTFLGIFILFSSIGLYDLKPLVILWVQKVLEFPAGFWVGFGLIIINLVLLLFQSLVYEKIRTISFDNPEGEVSISVKAVEDFVKKIGQGMSSVIDVNPYILPYKDGVKVKLGLAVESDVNLLNLPAIALTTLPLIRTIPGIPSITCRAIVEIASCCIFTFPNPSRPSCFVSLFPISPSINFIFHLILFLQSPFSLL